MRWPGATSRNIGSCSEQRAKAKRQRGAKRQPGGGLISIGTEPPIASSRVLCALSRSMRGIELINPCVYGWRGLSNRLSTSASSTTLPAYMTTTRCAVSATTPMAWVISMTAMPKRSFMSCRRSRICAWIVTSSAVVGSSAMTSLGLQASAMAIMTRWRMPHEIAALEQDLAVDDAARRHRDQLQDRHRGDGLAAAGLADHAERLALVERDVDAVDRLQHAVVGSEVGLQALDLEQRRHQITRL